MRIQQKTGNRLLAILLTGALAAGSLSGCGGKAQETAALVEGESPAEAAAAPLVIAAGEMSGNFSPFFSESAADENMWQSTSAALLNTDRNGGIVYKGISGETRHYNGSDYAYTGIADCLVTENENGTVYYDFTLRDGVKYSDGETMTIDDVIFSYYVYLDPSYDGQNAISTLPIAGLEAYQDGSAEYINGIQKTGNGSLRVVLTEACAPAVYDLSIYVSPLHYYGDPAQYDYENKKFGFPKGDLSSIRAKNQAPMGAGPYKFVSFENGIVSMEANEHYYKGIPAYKYLQWKTMTEAEKLSALLEGTVDIATLSPDRQTLKQIKDSNSNGELSGDKLVCSLIDYRAYGYIGINPGLMKVGSDPGSDASKNFRKAIATLLAAYRASAIDSYYGEAAYVIDYPISNADWVIPKKSDEDYKAAFATDSNGNDIYSDGMSGDERQAAALQAALSFFKAAGYTVKDGKLTAAPKEARMDCTFAITGNGAGDHPAFALAAAAKEALDSIGFQMEIKDLSDPSELWSGLEAGTIDLWCAAWSVAPDPDLFQIYHSGGTSAQNYRINQKKLDQLIVKSRTTMEQTSRKELYREALGYIADYAVEIPFYQRRECIAYSAERIHTSSIVKDPTAFWGCLNELEKISSKEKS